MTDPLRVGVVGTGFWGTHVAEQFVDHPDATVVALADVDEGSREEAGKALGVDPGHHYEDEEAMRETEHLDAVQVTSPHALHQDHVGDALRRDLHVFCEKPLTTGTGRAVELARLADESRGTLMIGYQRHVAAPYRRVREAIATGDLTPTFVTAEITQNWLETVEGTWRVEPALSGGGQLYDSGSHLVDAVAWLLDDDPVRVTAEMAFADDDERLDAQAALTVRFDRGAVASFGVSGDAPDVHERIGVRGDGRATIEGEGWTDRELRLTGPDGSSETVTGELSTYDKVDAFLRAVRAGEDPPATARDALRATAIKEAAYESARTGRRVEVDLDR